MRCFAEFSLVPDLLREHQAGSDTLGDWGRRLDGYGYNQEHIENEFDLTGMSLTEYVAADAMRFCEWTGLLLPNGDLAPSGRRLADMAAVPQEHRNKLYPGVLTRVLAEQVQDGYLGDQGISLTDLLIQASQTLWMQGDAWPYGLQGLLLVEMETLVHWAFLDGAAAERILQRLPSVRLEVIAALSVDPEVQAGREVVDATVVADTLAEVHWSRPELAQESTLTVTELRATAMAMTFAELLSQSLFTLPLQVLRPRGKPEYAG